MSGSEAGVMTSSSSRGDGHGHGHGHFSSSMGGGVGVGVGGGLVVQKERSPVPVVVQSSHSQPVVQTMRLSFSTDGTAVYKPVAGNSPTYHHSDSSAVSAPHGGINMNLGATEPLKRKRGRPRKYGPDGTMSLTHTPAPPPPPVSASQSPPAPPPPPPTTIPGGLPSPTSLKKGRGRPPGSSKKQQMEALGSIGVGFTPHVINVKAGEDVSSKIMSFSQNGPRAVCILSANGAISNVTLRQPATAGGAVTYEGRFEILSLSGSFLLTESGGQRSRTGGLSVSLSGPDGRVLGGGVAGILTAASPVQVIVGSFVADGRKEVKPANQMEPLSAPSKLGQGGGAMGASSPTSRGTLSESSGGPGSPLNQSTGTCNNSHLQGISSMPWK